ncbi:MAG: hypothetical protein ABMB14_11960 [Myxococcota bacterium]
MVSLVTALSLAALSGCRSDPVPPCAGETWGAIDDPAHAIHVRPDGDDAGDGTERAPVRTLAAALGLARDGGPRTVALGAGVFPASLSLVTDAGDGRTDDGLRLQGCSADETSIVPDPGARAASTGGVPGSTVTVTAAQDVTLSDLTFDGGDRPLFVWGGAEVTVVRVRIVDATASGFVVDGPYTIVHATDVEVHRTTASGGSTVGAGGYGVEIDGATVDWTGGGVWASTAAGIVVTGDTGALTLDGATVADTLSAADGRFGRGVQVQQYATAALTGCTLAANVDAGLFSLLGQGVSLDGVTVDGTAGATGGTGTGGTGVGGDGIVVTGIDADGRQLDPATFTVSLAGNTIGGVARAGIVVERVTAALDGNVVTGTAPDAARVAQEGAVVTGTDPVTVATTPLGLVRDALAPVGRR